MEFLRGTAFGAGDDPATAVTVINGYRAVCDGINRIVGVVNSPATFIAQPTTAGSPELLDGELDYDVWQGGIKICGRSWLNPPVGCEFAEGHVRVGLVVESESGWRSPLHIFVGRTTDQSGWVVTGVGRFNTTSVGATMEW